MDKYQIFKNAISNRDAEISKETLFEYAKNNNIQIKNKRISRIDLVNEIYFSCKEKFFDDFKTELYIPHWQTYSFFDITSRQLENLRNSGFLKEAGIDYKEKTFSSKYEKYQAFAYQATILELDKADFVEILQEICTQYAVRIETQTEEEVSKLINKFTAVGEISKNPASYKHRNGKGYYTYFSIRPFSHTKHEQNKYLADIKALKAEIKSLKEKIEQMKKEQNEIIDKTLNEHKHKISTCLNISEDFSMIDLMQLRSKLENTEKKHEKREKNERGAGRKAKFSDEQIQQMKEMRKIGKTHQEIADFFHVTRQTVIKYLK